MLVRKKNMLIMNFVKLSKNNYFNLNIVNKNYKHIYATYDLTKVVKV